MKNRRFDDPNYQGGVSVDGYGEQGIQVSLTGRATAQELRDAGFGTLDEEFSTFVTLTVDIGRTRVIWFGNK